MTVTDQQPPGLGPLPAGADHALLTRFNLPSAGAESLIRAKEGWLRRRVELFEAYCLPSVAAQSTADFSWLVYFDPQSPDWLLERIEAWRASSPMTALFREEVPRADLLADLAAATGAGRSHLITTNLDNDDGLARDFVARVQGARTQGGRTAIYCSRGLIATRDRVYERTDRRNAFASVREPWADAQTCWSQWHNLLDRQMPVVEVSGPAAWLQVVHGENVSNRIRGRLGSADSHRARFPGLIDEVLPLSRAALRRDRFVDAPRRLARDGIRSGLRSAGIRVLGRDGFDHAKARLAQRLARRTDRPVDAAG